jgi:hypothetical protein
MVFSEQDQPTSLLLFFLSKFISTNFQLPFVTIYSSMWDKPIQRDSLSNDERQMHHLHDF